MVQRMFGKPSEVRVLRVVVAVALIPLLSHCGPKGFRDGNYDDPSRVNLMDDRFSETDLQQLAQDTVQQLVQCGSIQGKYKAPRVIAEPFRNMTEEHIDMTSLMDKMRVAMTNSGKLKFIAKEERGTLEEEYQHNESGAVRADSRKRRGQQTGADYILRGVLATNIQQVGDKKTIYYKFTTRLTNLETSEIDCITEKEIRKAYTKKSIGL